MLLIALIIIITCIVIYYVVTPYSGTFTDSELSKTEPVITTSHDTYVNIGHVLPDGHVYETPSASSVDACVKNCTSDSACDGFSYNGIDQMCDKFRLNRALAMSAYWRQSAGGFIKVPGQSLKSKLIKSAIAQDEGICAKACLGRDDCGAFEYDPGVKQCNLRAINSAVDNISGVLPARLSAVDLAKTS